MEFFDIKFDESFVAKVPGKTVGKSVTPASKQKFDPRKIVSDTNTANKNIQKGSSY